MVSIRVTIRRYLVAGMQIKTHGDHMENANWRESMKMAIGLRTGTWQAILAEPLR